MPRYQASLDDPNLVSRAGLAPVLELTERAGLHDVVGERVHLDRAGAQNPVLKIILLIAGVLTDADSIVNMSLLRHGAMRRLCTGLRALTTLGEVPARVHHRPRPAAQRRRVPAALRPDA
jgi:hypothetical protein